MRKLPAALGAFALATVATLSSSTPAVAATGDFGNDCIAVVAPPTNTWLIVTNAAGSTLPATAPSSGVITKATVSLPAGGFAFPSKLKVARGTGVANQYTVQAESTVFTVGGGVQSYPVRVPVTTGDLIGLGGQFAFGCSSAGSSAAVLNSDAAVGSPQTYTPAANASVPLVATVEPDADHDGYGDVTQDQCPQSASIQGVCPVVKVATFAAESSKGITLIVTVNNQASVKVTGLAKVNGKKIKLKGGTKTVGAGGLTQFKVKLPTALKAALARLSSSKTIKVTLTATATDVIGRKTTSKSKVKLHGTHR